MIILSLFTSCTADNTFDSGECPDIDFYATPLQGKAPLEVSFTATVSDDISSYYWDFGDGTDSQRSDPVHIYEEEGIYTVILVVDGENGIDVD